MNKVVAIILAWAAMSTAPAIASQPVLAIEAIGRIVDGKAIVEFKVTNTTSQTVQVSVRQLPWKNRNNTVLVVVNKKSGEVARPKFRIDDNFESDILEIGAGKSAQGTVSLDRYVVGLRELLLKEDALVFWHFAGGGDGSAVLGEQGGWFVLSRVTSR